MEESITGYDGAGATACQSTEELLRQVTSQLNAFEAKKLPELKAELEAFVKKKDGLASEYEQKYRPLRERWCLQHQQVEKLYAALKCAFPNWKDTVSTCVCKPIYDTRCFEQRLTDRKWCSQGKLGRARDTAKFVLDQSKAWLDALQANAQKAGDELTALDKLLKDIQAGMSGPEQETVLYSFWFDALPRHKRLAPEDVSADCKAFGDAETPEELCASVWDVKCPPDEGACARLDPKGAAPSTRPRRAAPWLLPPAKYSTELDRAWDDYHDAKDGFAEKDAAFRAAPDDLDSMAKALEAQKKAQEDGIRKCLKSSRPDDMCCKPAATPPTTAAAASAPRPGDTPTQSAPAPSAPTPSAPAASVPAGNAGCAQHPPASPASAGSDVE